MKYFLLNFEMILFKKRIPFFFCSLLGISVNASSSIQTLWTDMTSPSPRVEYYFLRVRAKDLLSTVDSIECVFRLSISSER